MILFWVAAALLTAGIVIALAHPLMRRDESLSGGGADLAVYRDQLADLERDRARGLIEPAEAASLEAELGRRMLSAARNAEPLPAAAPRARWLTLTLAAAFPLAALVIYLAVGRPDLPALPLAERQTSPAQDPAKVLAAIAEVRSKLKQDPADLDRWVMVAEAYAKLGRPRDAIDALRVADQLSPHDPGIAAMLAETLIAADGGAVGAEAKRILGAIPDGSEARPEARYYLALADFQAGDAKAALAGWQALLAESPADAGWIGATRARIAEAATSLGLDPAKETPAPQPSAPPVAAGPGSASPDAAAIAKMAPEQQQDMIRGMVASLAAKLEANPDNPSGWRQLARAYQVLGEDDKAKSALDRAAAAEAKGAVKP
jgi:cytochrome c-type biogenesis protein CcmH